MMPSVAIILSLAAMAIASVCRPSRAQCPIGYDLRTGIRRDGRFECWPSPPWNSLYDGAGGYEERSPQRDGIIQSRIFCTGGSQPIAGDDGRTVGCTH